MYINCGYAPPAPPRSCVTHQWPWGCFLPSLLLNLVHPFAPLETLPTCIYDCLQSIVFYAAFSASLGVSLAHFYYFGTDPSLNYSHRLALTEVRSHFIGVYQGCVFCVLLRDSKEYFPLQINSSLNRSFSLPSFSLSFSAHSSMFLGGIYAQYMLPHPLTKWPNTC